MRLLREPLVQFLLLGAALFILYRGVAPEPATAAHRIVVDGAQVARLTRGFERTWLRSPTRAELAGLIEDQVTEEILYREALALGLDQNDLVIRRRLRQKMDFLNEEIGSQREPTDAELQAFLDAHAEKFAAPARTSFYHVYVKVERNREQPHARAGKLRNDLETGAVAAEEAGDATLLPRRLLNASTREIARSFGSPFAAELDEVPADGGWYGPIETDYGLHLVSVTERDPGGPPPLSAVRSAVEREWRAVQRAEARERFYAALREGYTISVEVPDETYADVVKQ